MNVNKKILNKKRGLDLIVFTLLILPLIPIFLFQNIIFEKIAFFTSLFIVSLTVITTIIFFIVMKLISTVEVSGLNKEEAKKYYEKIIKINNLDDKNFSFPPIIFATLIFLNSFYITGLVYIITKVCLILLRKKILNIKIKKIGDIKLLYPSIDEEV